MESSVLSVFKHPSFLDETENRTKRGIVATVFHFKILFNRDKLMIDSSLLIRGFWSSSLVLGRLTCPSSSTLTTGTTSCDTYRRADGKYIDLIVLWQKISHQRLVIDTLDPKTYHSE